MDKILAGLCVSDHEVGEPLDVAARPEDDLWCDRGTLNLEHVLLEHKVLAPSLSHVGLDRAALMRGMIIGVGD